jgi:hypothetical protein
MPLDKKHATVANEHWKHDLRRFFAMCKSAGLNADNTKDYYHSLFHTQHLKDLTESQWAFMFEELEIQVKEKAEKDGVLFVKDLNEAMESVLGN